MCGFVGIIDFKKNDNLKEVKYLNNLISYRGPDSEGYYFKRNKNFSISVGHKRLSILDISKRSDQPFKYKNFVLFFNGEIYNYLDIKKKLEDNGYIFETTSDTEVLIKSFDFWGISCVKYFNGIFAFVIYDENKNKVFFSRDFFGVKPLYISENQNNIIFASEARCVFQFSGFTKDINKNAISSYLRFGYIQSQQRIFNNLISLEKGSYLEIDIENFNLSKKVNFYKPFSKSISINENIKKNLKDLLVNSCEKRLVSDAPIGSFMSGGIDSTLLAAIVSKDLGKKIPYFTIVDKKISSSDDYNSRLVNSTLKNELNIYNSDDISKSINEIFCNIGSYFDEPFADISVIPSIFLSQVASNKVKVIITGDGADEIFGGYEKYDLILKRHNLFSKLPKKNILKKIINYYQRKFHNYNSQSLNKICAHLSDNVNLIDEYNNYGLNSNIIKPKFLIRQNSSNFQNSIQNFLKFEKNHYLLHDILFKLDRCTMSKSVEGREPYLDYQLNEYVENNLDQNSLINKKALKEIHKDYFKSIPYDYDSKKKGFAISHSHCFNDNNRNFINNLMSEKFLKSQDVFNYQEISKLYKKNNKQFHDFKQLYVIVCFQMWWKQWM